MKKALLLLIVLVFSCKKDKTETKIATEDKKEILSSYNIIDSELLVNNKFRSWDTNAKPSNWDINETMDIPEEYVVDRDTLDMLLKGNQDELIYLKQSLTVEPNAYYIFEANIETRLRSGMNSGLVVTSNSEDVLGRRIFKTRSEGDTKVIFNSKEFNEITCYIGFLSKGVGEISIKSISLKKVDVNNSIFESNIAQNFLYDFELNFDNKNQFDKSISILLKGVSDIMMSTKKNDTVNMARKDRLMLDLEEPSFLKTFLEGPTETITQSYASKLVFGGEEALNYFNIGTRVIEFRANNKRIHLALMYYNPFIDSWVTIDPFYNSKILANENLESLEPNQIIQMEYGGLINNDSEGLLNKYKNSTATIQKEKSIGFPF